MHLTWWAFLMCLLRTVYASSGAMPSGSGERGHLLVKQKLKEMFGLPLPEDILEQVSQEGKRELVEGK